MCSLKCSAFWKPELNYWEYVVYTHRIKKLFPKSEHYVFVHRYFHKMIKCLCDEPPGFEFFILQFVWTH